MKQELCIYCVKGKKQEVAIVPHSPRALCCPGGKEAGWPRLLLLTLAGQQAPDSCTVWNTQVLKARGKVPLLSWWAAACPFREPGSLQVVTKAAQLHRVELQGCLLPKHTRSVLCRQQAETHSWKGQRKFLECHFCMRTLRFLTVIAVANNRKKLLSIVLLPYHCLNCCISRLNCKDAPDREVTLGFHTPLGDCERFWSQKTNWEMGTLANQTVLTTSGNTRAWWDCQTKINSFCCKNSASARRSL